MDDTVAGNGWLLDDETRRALRLDRIRRALKRGAFDEAIVEAEEMLDDVPGDADGLVLLGDASLETGDIEVAARAFEHALRLSNGKNAQALQGLAIARFELCDLVGCMEAAREALRQQPDAADAHYFLGLAQERLGQDSAALTSFAAARQLAPAAYPYPLQLDADAWRAVVRQALSEVEPEIRRFWTGVPIMLEVEPTLEELRGADPPISPRVSGLYVGEPPQDRDPGRARPEALRLFTKSLSRCPSSDELVAQIADTLHTEALNWLGLPPPDASGEPV